MSPFWSAATIASVADSATERKRLSDSRSASASCVAGDHAAELAADVRGDLEQAVVRA